MSLEPAVAAVTGFVIASQKLSPFEIVVIVAVMIAAAGASWTSGGVAAEVPTDPAKSTAPAAARTTHAKASGRRESAGHKGVGSSYITPGPVWP